MKQEYPADTKLVLTITDNAGTQVRRCELDKTAGLRRFVWNLNADRPDGGPSSGGGGGGGEERPAPRAAGSATPPAPPNIQLCVPPAPTVRPDLVEAAADAAEPVVRSVFRTESIARRSARWSGRR